MTRVEELQRRFIEVLVPQFISDPKRRMEPSGFRADWSNIDERDASDCLRALDANLLEHTGRGQYKAKKSYYKEQFFNSGPAEATPRPFYISFEPIIAVAWLARMHFDYGWPAHLLGLQPKDSAFDAVVYQEADDENELIACEVKKSVDELDRLVSLIKQFAQDGRRSDAGLRPHEKNAWKKVEGLRARNVPVFWALGPGTKGYLYAVAYDPAGSIILFHLDTHDALYSHFIK